MKLWCFSPGSAWEHSCGQLRFSLQQRNGKDTSAKGGQLVPASERQLGSENTRNNAGTDKRLKRTIACDYTDPCDSTDACDSTVTALMPVAALLLHWCL